MPVSISRSGEFVVIKNPGYSIKLNSVSNKVDAESNIRVGGGDPYTGTYTVIPSTSQQILDTQFKVLSDDVTVTEIPYVETVNESDGITVSIAS